MQQWVQQPICCQYRVHGMCARHSTSTPRQQYSSVEQRSSLVPNQVGKRTHNVVRRVILEHDDHHCRNEAADAPPEEWRDRWINQERQQRACVCASGRRSLIA
eukprot:2592050-Prymnesium_polylepis.4